MSSTKQTAKAKRSKKGYKLIAVAPEVFYRIVPTAIKDPNDPMVRAMRDNQGRFSPARETDDPIELLYLCQHHNPALQEVDAVFGRWSLQP